MVNFERQIFRIPPTGPVSAYKTYAISAPQSTHFVDESCEAAECGMWANGWQSFFDESSELGQDQAGYVRHRSGRRYTESRDESGRTVFTFPPGQECFSQHRRRLDREEVYVVRGGDWRGNPRRELLVHDSPQNWLDDFGAHQDKIDGAVNG